MAITGTFKSQSILRRGNVRQVSRVYTYNKDFDWESEMPAQGTYDAGRELYFTDYSQSNPNPVYIEVTTFESSEQDWEVVFQPEDNDTVWYADATVNEEAIETHKDFLMKWAFQLWQRASMADATPAFHATATDASDAVGIQWLWSKTHPGKGWMLQEVETKIGVEAYFNGGFISRSEEYHRSQSAAEAALRENVKISAPDEDFGYTDGSFLVLGVNTRYDGKYWIAVANYHHAPDPGWDTEIYEAATTA